jgi:lysophospholipase L1-like esterase
MIQPKYFLILLVTLFSGCKKYMYDETVYRKKIMGALVKKVNYLGLGDSYTIGQSIPPELSFPNQLTDSLNTEPYIQVTETRIIAQTGWTTTNLLTAIETQTNDETYDLVTLLIGVNNEYQGKTVGSYRKDFITCLQKAIRLAGNDTSRVMVISIPDYGYTPSGTANRQYISPRIDAFNAVNKQLADSFRITYVDITPISRSDLPDLVAEDYLHPSGTQYKLWVDKMYAQARQKIQKY